jgi:phage tail protein X
MIRYNSTPTTTRWDGKRVYLTTLYPYIPAQNTDVQIITDETDYLDALAYKYYGDATLYWIIAVANNLGKGRLSVPPGLTLRIPININDIVAQFNRMNS